MTDLLLRAGRYLFWGSPALYAPFGRLRRRSVFRPEGCAMWVGGFPRSSNTYTGYLLESCMGQQGKVVYHLHLPPQIIAGLRSAKPGLFVLRVPEDAVVSWAIYTGFSLRHCLHYYIDFHRILMPHLDDLFVAPFGMTTTAFPSVLKAFNTRYNLSLPAPGISDAEVKQHISEDWEKEDGTLNEMQVPRPSDERTPLKHSLKAELLASRSLERSLRTARALRAAFLERSPLRAEARIARPS